MKEIEFWHRSGCSRAERARTIVNGIEKEFKNSIRFSIGNGETVTIKRKDIISIEEVKQEENNDVN